jgi:probable F420-dependent oxidoreductase
MPVDLGPLGVWSFGLDQEPATRAQELAAELEAAGWGAIWLPEAVGRDPLVHAGLLLDATNRIVLATGIAGIYSRDAIAMNAGWQSLSEAFPARFLLGLGVSHQPMVEGMRGAQYRAPVATMREYLDRMDAAIYLAAPPTEPPERVLAALGPKMLELARERARGAHPYLVTPEHTAMAREILGPDRLLAPEQKVVLENDPTAAREIARAALAVYIPGLPNYVNNLRRLGFTDDDLGDVPSDRLVDALVAWGDVDAIAARVRAHHDAGADHVALQVLPYGDAARAMRDTRTLAEALL